MNKTQKALVGTALSATLVATVGFGTYSTFTGDATAGDSDVTVETAEMDVNVDSGEAVSLVDHEDGLDHLLPGETWSAEPFTISNDGDRAITVGNLSDNGYSTNESQFNFSGSILEVDGADELLNMDFTFDIEGEKTTMSENYGSSYLSNALEKGQYRGSTPPPFHTTLLPGESMEIALDVTLDEEAGNEFQGKDFGAEFYLKYEQNNEAEID
ncbi:hypothetical protein [Salisediminibacterium halotolerans]|uniref:hypothetical protein n=1 Tax=Salisediminibacterium halotolerans TaxID=517425 RepID=UPI000EAF919C|nr:hypothetical protein [Salisediminibacterium halotolerans]RLJ81087.1 hypothetical protein BCL39_0024 [Actinophytocola xinjiangensis]RPE84104.1 hypothetical protein EDD67_2667 [Salisediminibacterium halotolerans]TWG38514.1 hypothetical protein BCL52_0024 [Salisediminibacterium halotolerans]GEL09093.1 hypothetical protein SHA02_25090 [Salisediminibacterium halotolerans]